MGEWMGVGDHQLANIFGDCLSIPWGWMTSLSYHKELSRVLKLNAYLKNS